MKGEINNIIAGMPVVILAGGAGINLGLNGSMIPKTMVEVNGVPLLLYIMDHYSKAGFRKFIICAGYGLEKIKELPGLSRKDWDVNVVDTGINNMTGSRLAQVSSMADYSSVFCLTYGDTLSDANLRDLLLFHLSHGRTATLLAAHNPTRFRILGLYDVDDIVKGFSERPVLEKDYVCGGFYIFNREIFDLKKLSVDPACVLETDVLEELVSKKELYAYRHNGFWQPLDNERDRKNLSLFLKKTDKT